MKLSTIMLLVVFLVLFTLPVFADTSVGFTSYDVSDSVMGPGDGGGTGDLIDTMATFPEYNTTDCMACSQASGNKLITRSELPYAALPYEVGWRSS